VIKTVAWPSRSKTTSFRLRPGVCSVDELRRTTSDPVRQVIVVQLPIGSAARAAVLGLPDGGGRHVFHQSRRPGILARLRTRQAPLGAHSLLGFESDVDRRPAGDHRGLRIAWASRAVRSTSGARSDHGQALRAHRRRPWLGLLPSCRSAARRGPLSGIQPLHDVLVRLRQVRD